MDRIEALEKRVYDLETKIILQQIRIEGIVKLYDGIPEGLRETFMSDQFKEVVAEHIRTTMLDVFKKYGIIKEEDK